MPHSTSHTAFGYNVSLSLPKSGMISQPFFVFQDIDIYEKNKNKVLFILGLQDVPQRFCSGYSPLSQCSLPDAVFPNYNYWNHIIIHLPSSIMLIVIELILSSLSTAQIYRIIIKLVIFWLMIKMTLNTIIHVESCCVSDMLIKLDIFLLFKASISKHTTSEYQF